MKLKRLFAQILAVTLCLALLCPLAAFAEDTGSYVPKDPDSYAILDPAAMQKLVEDYADAKGYNRDNIRVGYSYLDADETWFYNGDKWGFGAGVYYVPMMMLLSEWESSGKLTRDSMIQGYALGDAERLVLVEGNNAVKNQIMGAFGSDREMREKIRAYSSLPESYYDADFMNYTYLSPRYLVDVMKTLYNENERFPNILECMKQRGVNDYFHGAMGGAYDVAQQYGAFEEGGGTEYNNCVGIIYTPHPFILVVMTRNLGHTQEVMRDMAIIFKDYTLTLDSKYDSWSASGVQTAPAPAVTVTEPGEPAENTEPAAEGENEQPAGPAIIQIPGSETPAEAETPAEEQTEPGDAVIIQPEEQETAAEEQTQQEEQQPEQQQPEQQEKQTKAPNTGRMILLLIGAAILVILFLASIIRIIKRRRDEDEDEDDEDDEDEDEDEDEED